MNKMTRQLKESFPRKARWQYKTLAKFYLSAIRESWCIVTFAMEKQQPAATSTAETHLFKTIY